MNLIAEFGYHAFHEIYLRNVRGGMELLFENKREISIDLASPSNPNIQDLLVHMRDNLLKERPELFMQGNTMYSIPKSI